MNKSDCCNAKIKTPEITFWAGLPGERPSPTCTKCGRKILFHPVKNESIT